MSEKHVARDVITEKKFGFMNEDKVGFNSFFLTKNIVLFGH